MRIWHQSSIEIEDLAWFMKALTAHAKHVRDGASIDIHGIASGSYQGRHPSDGTGYAFVHHRLLEPVLKNAVRAEQDGYDAFVIGSFSEPFLREVRSAVDIPVVSTHRDEPRSVARWGATARPCPTPPRSRG